MRAGACSHAHAPAGARFAHSREVELPPAIKDKLRQMVAYSKAQAVLFGQWGFEKQHGRAQARARGLEHTRSHALLSLYTHGRIALAACTGRCPMALTVSRHLSSTSLHPLNPSVSVPALTFASSPSHSCNVFLPPSPSLLLVFHASPPHPLPPPL
eukprot:6172469-Pleurochrysis_carterae.AAC.1